MAKEIEIPMHGPEGRYVTLADVLRCVNGEPLRWRVLEFSGVGRMPNGMSVDEFERVANFAPGGVPFEWASLLEFAAALAETHDLSLVGTGDDRFAEQTSLDDERLSGAPVYIQALDSGRWVVSGRAEFVNAAALARLSAEVRAE
ncbi:hypothetical protein [Allokutzneria sp. NRRL B-24872]|uniref:hypothetical protein n=1 Tax=Allokutzneria sp. NRRL B-24872 TaxID=1137961 RepID=UPI000A378962|nr:hypothetical protein [Allokutzneria sp. NRRL B-24872]